MDQAQGLALNRHYPAQQVGLKARGEGGAARQGQLIQHAAVVDAFQAENQRAAL